MNRIILLIFAILLFSCGPEETQTAEEIKESLKEIVVGETQAYMEKNYEKWASYWDQSNDVLRLDVSKDGFSQKRGWDKNGAKLEAFFKDNPEPITSTFVNSNYHIFYDVNLAWVAFDQTWTSQIGEESVAKGVVTLIKKQGAWKIITYTAIQYEANDQDIDTLERE